MAWPIQLTIPYYLCDYTDHLNLWSLARLFQDAADDHTEHFGIGFKSLIQNDKAWALSRMFYKVHNMPAALHPVTVQTWSRKVDRIAALRDTQMLDVQGNVLAAATAMWVIIDMKQRSVVPMLPEVIDFTHEPRQATDRDKLNKLRMKETMPLVARFVAQHSAIDHNLHVNNSDYIRWAVDAVKTTEDSLLHNTAQIDSIEINYLAETRLGDTVSLYMQCDAHVRHIVIENPRGISTTMVLTLK